MKKTTFLKTFLVAVGLLMGTSAWADPNYMTTMTGLLGLTDNSAAAWTYYSKTVTLKAGETYTYTFQNYTKGSSATAESETWIAEIRENTTNYCLDARGDGGGWKWEPSSNNLSYNYTGKAWNEGGRSLSDFMTAYNNVTVTLTISCSNDGKEVTIARTATLNGDTDFSGTWTCSNFAGNDKTINLIAEKSHLYITKVDCNSTQFNYVSSESAYVDAGNTTTNYNGASLDNLHVYYTQFRDWSSGSDGSVKYGNNDGKGELALYKFDLTEIKNKLATDGGTITGVNFTLFGEAKDNGGTCAQTRILGYNPTWSSNTITQATLTNNGNKETLTGTVSGLGSFQPLNTTSEYTIAALGTGSTLEANALTYVNSAIAANKDYVTIAIISRSTRGAFLKTWANLSFTYVATVLYEATFSETNSLSPTVTVYTDNERTIEIAKNELEANTTYYYRAVLAGYENYEGSFDVTTSNPAVNFTMTIKPRYTFTVNAVNSVNSAVIQALYTDDDSYDGKTHNVSFPAYLTGVGNAVTYSKDNTTYYQSYTSASADATKTQSYTAYTGEAYFFEGEDITGATTYTTGTFGPRSSGGATGVLSAKTVTSLDAGVYKITARSIGKAGGTHSVYKESTSGDKIFDIATSTSGATNSAIITLDATTDIVADGGYYTTSDNGHGFDYFLIEKNPTVSATLGTNNYGTFASTYPLNLSTASLPSGVTAYKASVSGTTVTFTALDQTVPANTGILIKGTGTSVDIPVAASGTTVTDNAFLVNTTGATFVGDDSYYYFGLIKNSLTFGKFDPNGVAIPANKAYLKVLKTEVGGAREMNVVFEDNDATAISEAKSQQPIANGQFFDLQGRRVAQPAKGLYIVNGKKVIVK